MTFLQFQYKCKSHILLLLYFIIYIITTFMAKNRGPTKWQSLFVAINVCGYFGQLRSLNWYFVQTAPKAFVVTVYSAVRPATGEKQIRVSYINEAVGSSQSVPMSIWNANVMFNTMQKL